MQCFVLPTANQTQGTLVSSSGVSWAGQGGGYLSQVTAPAHSHLTLLSKRSCSVVDLLFAAFSSFAFVLIFLCCYG